MKNCIHCFTCCTFFALIYSLSMISCTEYREEIVTYKVGDILQFDDIISLNNDFVRKALEGEFRYETLFCIEDGEFESYPWRDEIEKVLKDRRNGYSGAIIFRTYYSDDMILEHFFARKPTLDSFVFVYLGVTDSSNYLVREHYAYREKF